jgi:ferritin-like metal-binding protein YciE
MIRLHKNIDGPFNADNLKWTNEDVIMSIIELNSKYEHHINELKTQIEKLTQIVYDLQKINIRVDDKTNEISNGIQQIIENN